MRKVTTINLNHNACQIDEDGYEALRQYLEDAELALANNPDRAEIVADLEQAIADKCRVALGQYKTVVGAAEIERILKEMGPVVSGGEENGAGTDGTAPNAKAASGSSQVRYLYRILDGERWTLTGVCNGIAACAGVDRNWVRVAFVLLTVFTGGIWLLVYFLLVFLIPIASTPEELSAAHGQPFNAQELVDRVRKKHDEFRAARHSRRGKRHGHSFATHQAARAPVPGNAPGAASRMAGGVMLPVFTALSACWFAVMAVAAILVWHVVGQPGFEWPHGHANLAHLPRWIPLVAVIAIYALLALPIGAGRRTALYYTNGGHSHGWADAWSGLLWIALVAVALVGAWMALPQLQEFLRHVLGWHGPTWAAQWT